MLTCWLTGCGRSESPGPPTVRISAAASIAYILEDLADPLQRDLSVRIEVNAGASGTLTQQIEQGQPADLFISADTRWVDRLDAGGLTETGSRVVLATNRLVVIALAQMPEKPTTLEALADPAYQPVAVGDPAYVPAGRYAVQALAAHRLGPAQGLTLAEAPNVRAALAYVQHGQCPVGLVYASDVRDSDGVVVLISIDPADHDPIHYPAAVIRDAPQREQALRVLNWLKGERARSAFRDAGFSDPNDPRSDAYGWGR